MHGDATLLARMVYLLDCAVRHNAPGGWIRVAVEQLAQPFRTADGLGSLGLGLAIVPRSRPRTTAGCGCDEGACARLSSGPGR